MAQIHCGQVVYSVSTVGTQELRCRLPFYTGQVLSAHKSSVWGTCIAFSGHLGLNGECCSIFTVVCGHQALSNRMRFGRCSQEIHLPSPHPGTFFLSFYESRLSEGRLHLGDCPGELHDVSVL